MLSVRRAAFGPIIAEGNTTTNTAATANANETPSNDGPLLDLTDAALAWLGRVGYDPVYGARPLKRAVQRYLQDPLAEKLLAGEVPDGSTVRIDEGDGALDIRVE